MSASALLRIRVRVLRIRVRARAVANACPRCCECVSALLRMRVRAVANTRPRCREYASALSRIRVRVREQLPDDRALKRATIFGSRETCENVRKRAKTRDKFRFTRNFWFTQDESWLTTDSKAIVATKAMCVFLRAARNCDCSVGAYFDTPYRVIAAEIRLYDPVWRIVGSIDLVRYRTTEADGTLVVDIDDWKFSKKAIASDVVTFNKYAYQQTIYALMLERAAARAGKRLRVHGLRLVQLNPTLAGVNPQPKIIPIPDTYRAEVLARCETRGRVLPRMWRWISGTRAALVFIALLRKIRDTPKVPPPAVRKRNARWVDDARFEKRARETKRVRRAKTIFLQSRV